MLSATARADYVATEGSFELSISVGDELWVWPEQPEGAAQHGWCAVVRSVADEQPGLVPIDYLELSSDEAAAPPTPAEEQQPPPQEQREQQEQHRQQLSAWLTDAISTAAVTATDHGAALDAIALADFKPESAAELRLVAGERVAMLHGCEAPEGWAVALKRVVATSTDEGTECNEGEGEGLTAAAAPGGDRTAQGLVPAAYLSLLPFEATVTATHRPDAGSDDDARAADAAAADANGGSLLAVQRGERVMVQPSRSTPSCWWAQRYLPKIRLWLRYDASASGGGAAGLSPGEEGLVPRECLAPVPSETLREALRREAHLLRAEGVIARAVMCVGAARRHRRRREAARLVQRCWRGGAARARVRHMRRAIEEAAEAAVAVAEAAAAEVEAAVAEAAAAEAEVAAEAERRLQQRRLQQQARLPRRRRPSERLDEERAAAASELEQEGEAGAGSGSSRDSSPSFGRQRRRTDASDTVMAVLLGPVAEAAAAGAVAAPPATSDEGSQHAAEAAEAAEAEAAEAAEAEAAEAAEAAAAATTTRAVAAARLEVARQVRAAEARLSASLEMKLRAATSRREGDVKREALELTRARGAAGGGGSGGGGGWGQGDESDNVLGRAGRAEERLRIAAAEARAAEERAAAAERLVQRATDTLQTAARDVRALRRRAAKAEAAADGAQREEAAVRGAMGRAQQRNASLSAQLAAAAERVALLQQGRQGGQMYKI